MGKDRAVGKGSPAPFIPGNPQFDNIIASIIPRAPKEDQRSKANERLLTYNADGAIHPLIYGEVKNVGAAVSYWKAISLGRILVRYVIGYGPIESITNIRVDNKTLTELGILFRAQGYVGGINPVYHQIFLGTADQQPSSLFTSIRGPLGWVTNRAPGVAFVDILFPDYTDSALNTFPDITSFKCDVKGLKIRDYAQDPTLVTRYFSEDPALIIADLLTSKRYGGRIPDSQINWSWIASDVSPYIMEDLGGGVKRYPIGIVLNHSQDLDTHIENIRAHAQLLKPTYHNGIYNILVDKPRDYSGIHFTDENILEGSTLTTLGSSEVFERVNITYIDSAQGWIQKSTPIELPDLSTNSIPIDEKSFSLLGTRTFAQAKRIGTYLINRSILDKVLQFTTNEVGKQALPGDRVKITDAELNLSEQDITITDINPQDGKWAFTAEIYDEDVYSSVLQTEYTSIEPEYPSPHDILDPPTGLIITQINQPGQIDVHVEFTPAPINSNSLFTRIAYTILQGSYQNGFVVDTTDSEIFVRNVQIGDYLNFIVYTKAVAPFDNQSDSITDDITIAAPTIAAPTGLTLTQVVNLDGTIDIRGEFTPTPVIYTNQYSRIWMNKNSGGLNIYEYITTASTFFVRNASIGDFYEFELETIVDDPYYISSTGGALAGSITCTGIPEWPSDPIYNFSVANQITLSFDKSPTRTRVLYGSSFWTFTNAFGTWSSTDATKVNDGNFVNAAGTSNTDPNYLIIDFGVGVTKNIREIRIKHSSIVHPLGISLIWQVSSDGISYNSTGLSFQPLIQGLSGYGGSFTETILQQVNNPGTAARFLRILINPAILYEIQLYEYSSTTSLFTKSLNVYDISSGSESLVTNIPNTNVTAFNVLPYIKHDRAGIPNSYKLALRIRGINHAGDLSEPLDLSLVDFQYNGTTQLSSALLSSDGVEGVENKTFGTSNVIPWATLTGKPTTISGYGITDSYIDENAQDAIGTILVDSSTIDFTYTDATPAITAIVKDDSITYAKIQNVSATNKGLGRISASAGDIEEYDLTPAARSILDDTTVAAILATIGGAPLASPVFTTKLSVVNSAFGLAGNKTANITDAAGIGQNSTSFGWSTNAIGYAAVFENLDATNSLRNGLLVKVASSDTATAFAVESNSIRRFSVLSNGSSIFNGTARLKGYTVATLPAGTQGDMAFATDLLTPGFLVVAVGGGTIVGPVFYNGTNWVCY